MPLTLVPNSLIAEISATNIVGSTGLSEFDNTLKANLLETSQMITPTLCAGNILSSRIKLNNDTSSIIANNSDEFGFGVRDTLITYAGPFRLEHEDFSSTPRAPITRVVYNYTGANQTFVVPANIRFIYAKLWGAGGGAGRAGGWSYGADGGGGGHTRGVIPVTPGETLTLVVGEGGRTTNANARYGGGGGALNNNYSYAGNGGGYAGIFRAAVPLNNVDVLIVAGGGGGGSDMGGGGGGGGVLELNNITVSPGTYTITVGGGGDGYSDYGSRPRTGASGGNSVAFGNTAIGGSGGSSGHYYEYAEWGGIGPDATGGGSGGGGSAAYRNSGGRLGGAGTPGQGTAGGTGQYCNSTGDYQAGGGGGSEENSQVTRICGARPGIGGNGKVSNILGTPYRFGAGGGGAGYTGPGSGHGGLGGGGGGARWSSGTPGSGGTGGLNNGGNGAQGNSVGGGNGGSNTGSGGGGGGHSSGKGGNGGSGIVIVRYLGTQKALGGDSIYQTTIGGQLYTIHQFTSVGSYSFDLNNIGIDTALLIAGGGGGGGSTRAWDYGNTGGAGGGVEGCGGESPYDNRWNYAGTGGSQSAAGRSPGIDGTTIGNRFQGGNSNSNDYGGGGGGGWWGGGGGSYAESNTMGGGGGGSGYIHSSIIHGHTFAGFKRSPGYFWDEDLEVNVVQDVSWGRAINGYGGRNMQNNYGANLPSGGHAKIVIYY